MTRLRTLIRGTEPVTWLALAWWAWLAFSALLIARVALSVLRAWWEVAR